VTIRLRIPPGRAGRLWLRERLVLTDRAVSLLNTKIRLLRRELDRFDLAAARARDEWATAWNSATHWQARMLVGGGIRDLRLDAPPAAATVHVTTGSVMGVSYPETVTCELPRRSPDSPWSGTSAIVPAAAAFERALLAGGQLAAATAARDCLAREVEVTSQRLRALRDRWMPLLEASLRALETSLDEQERADSARLRWINPDETAGSL
jgi:V/A-type H+-transporting ATPase subunit D